jgi:hypothetical protein
MMATFRGMHFLAMLLTNTVVDDPNYVIYNCAVFAVQFDLLFFHVAIFTRQRHHLESDLKIKH